VSSDRLVEPMLGDAAIAGYVYRAIDQYGSSTSTFQQSGTSGLRDCSALCARRV
jgi:hypothetical protein